MPAPHQVRGGNDDNGAFSAFYETIIVGLKIYPIPK
jgi:hypothetical protein